MAVGTFLQSNYATLSGTAYPLAIDSDIAVAKRFVDAFAPHQTATPAMTVSLDAGHLYNLTTATLLEVGAQTTGTLIAPVTHPRIDRVVVSAGSGVFFVVTGIEAASPVAPAIPAGAVPVAQVLLQTTSSSITNSMLTDERALWMTGAVAQQAADIQAQWVMGQAVANGSFYFAFHMPYPGTIAALNALTGTGSFTVAVQINGVTVTGLSAVAVGASASTTPATALNTFSAGDAIAGVISAASGTPTNAVLNLQINWT